MNLRPIKIKTRGEEAVKSLREKIRRGRIRMVQAVLIQLIPRHERKLIVFLTPGYNWRVGGIFSIASLYQESIRMRSIHGATVVLCTVPGDPRFLRYSWFRNRNYILRLESVLRHCGQLESLLIHVPEYAVNRLVEWFESDASRLARKVKQVHVNVLLQNIDYVQEQNVAGLQRFGRVSCTTAHEAYSNLATRKALNVTLHRLSVYCGPEHYVRSSYEDKEPLLVVSPDQHPLKERILKQIATACPKLRIQIIQGLSYEAYKDLIRRAKWSLTFGEGMDGYFGEPVFSGGVSFAVYNERFFTPEFAKLQTVYPSWEALEQKITTDLVRFDNAEIYRERSRDCYELLASLYSVDKFRDNLRKFYLGDYTFP